VKAKLTGNVILLKVVCSYKAYENAFVKSVFGAVPAVPLVLWQYYSYLLCLKMEVLVLG